MKNVFNIIIEGPDGVGKSTLITGLFKHYNFRYMCYHRGDMSNFVFAKKFNRPFYATQMTLPFLYIYLTVNEAVLCDRIMKRSKEEHWHPRDTEIELNKLKDIELFEKAFLQLRPHYNIKRIDTSNLTTDEVLEEAIRIIDLHQSTLFEGADKDLSSWNQRYKKICDKLGIDFKVFDNQPYINGVPIMVESTLQNGIYETYDGKDCYDNTLYAMSYDIDEALIDKEKKYDFNYIINSKIRRRPEIIDYYRQMISHGKTCMVTGRDGILPKDIEESAFMIRQPDISGEGFIYNISKSAATVYCSRDLAGLELQTARLYEAILANNIVFVDKKTDPDSKILRRIYGNNYFFLNLLTVTPETLCDRYDEVISSSWLGMILFMQKSYLQQVFKEAKEFYKHD